MRPRSQAIQLCLHALRSSQQEDDLAVQRHPHESLILLAAPHSLIYEPLLVPPAKLGSPSQV